MYRPVVLLAMFAVVITSPLYANGHPVIRSAGVDLSNRRLVIQGVDLGNNPSVGLGTAVLSVEASSSAEIRAVLPESPLLPGSYILKVDFSSGPTAEIAVCIPSAGAPAEPTSGCGFEAPVIAEVAVIPSTPNVGTQVTIYFNVIDRDNEAGCSKGQTFLFRSVLTMRPVSSTAQLMQSLGPNPTLVPDVPGVYEIHTTVTDSTGRSGQRYMLVEAR